MKDSYVWALICASFCAAGVSLWWFLVAFAAWDAIWPFYQSWWRAIAGVYVIVIIIVCFAAFVAEESVKK